MSGQNNKKAHLSTMLGQRSKTRKHTWDNVKAKIRQGNFTLEKCTCNWTLIIIISTIIIVIFRPAAFLFFLFFQNHLSVVKQHSMQKLFKIPHCHFSQDWFKSTQPCIELFTCLCIECLFIIWLHMFIITQNYKIWCGTIQGWRIAPCSAQIICDLMIDIMVCINNELTGLWPSLPAVISNTMA